MGNLKSIMVNERSLTEKTIHCMILLIWNSRKGKVIKTQNKSETARTGAGERGLVSKRHKGTLGNEELLKSMTVVVIMNFKTHKIVEFYVNYTLTELN